jgi:hypothetical protein
MYGALGVRGLLAMCIYAVIGLGKEFTELGHDNIST